MATLKELRAILNASRTQFRNELATIDAASTKRLTAAYGVVVAAISSDIAALTARVNRNEDVSSEEMLRWGEMYQLREDLQVALSDFARLVEGVNQKTQPRAVQMGMFEGERLLEVMGVNFGKPSVEGIQKLINYVDGAAWQSEIANYGSEHSQHISDIVLADASLGKSPRFTAQHIVNYATGFPLFDALRLTRTTQIYSMREGSRQFYLANQDIVLGWRWSAALDVRTCPFCISQHGKTFKLTQSLNDHYQGRCGMIPITDLNRDEPVELGTEWFDKQPDNIQRRILAPARWQAWKKGEFTLEQMGDVHHDPIFGDMYRTASLKEIRKSAFDREAAIELFAPTPTDFKRDLTLPYYKARPLTIERMNNLDYGDADAELVEVLYKLYLPEEGKWDVEAARQEYAGLLYDIYKYGRDLPDIADTRTRAGAILHVFQQTQEKIKIKERRQLGELAYGDIYAEVDNIKDNRIASKGGGRGRKGGFIGATQQDNAQRLWESNMSWRALQDIRDGNVASMDWDFGRGGGDEDIPF